MRCTHRYLSGMVSTFTVQVKSNRKLFDPIDVTDGWNTELVVESLYCTLNGSSTVTSETSHRWGTPLSIGVLLATTRTNAIGIAVDALVAEWSLEFARFLEEAFK